MRTYILLILAVVCIIPTVTSLKCLICESDISDLHCFQRRKQRDCEGSFTCAKTAFNIKGHGHYFRGCIAHSYCNDPDSYCRAAAGRSNCEVYCCKGDKCNTANVAKTSMSFLLALALFSLLV